MATLKKWKTDGQDILSRLPLGCISHILSFTSPLDAVRSTLVSKAFKSESESDEVWRRFLPPDWEDFVSKSVAPVEFSSKRELYFRLCDSILIDGGNMNFSIDKMIGKKCFMLPARGLGIAWGGTPEYWTWNPHPRSRFAEVAVLKDVCWLAIHGLIGSHLLSPNTTYAAYLVMGYNEDAYGIDYPPAEVSVRLGNQVSEHTASLRFEESPGNAADDARIPQPRSDGWVEIELGECYHGEGDEGELQMSLKEIRGLHWKSGIIIEGIEIRPKALPKCLFPVRPDRRTVSRLCLGEGDGGREDDETRSRSLRKRVQLSGNTHQRNKRTDRKETMDLNTEELLEAELQMLSIEGSAIKKVTLGKRGWEGEPDESLIGGKRAKEMVEVSDGEVEALGISQAHLQ